MATGVQFGNNIDFELNQALRVLLENLSSPPASPTAGRIYFDTSLGGPQVYNGSAWAMLDATKLTAAIPNVALITNPLNRANHTGTQTASTISDLATVVKAYTLDSFAAPAADVSFGSHKITSLADPVNAQDAATKNYTDTNIQAAASGIQSKPPVAVVATTNITSLSGLPTVDGVTLTSGQRILLTAQTAPQQNGSYVVAAGAWARPTGDASPNSELTLGALWFVEQGTTYASTQWILAAPTSGTITPGTTNITINQFGAATTYTASSGVTKSGNNFSGVVDPAGYMAVSSAGFAAGPKLMIGAEGTITGDGATTSFNVTHSLGTQNIMLQVYDSNNNQVFIAIKRTSTTQATLSWGIAPASGTVFSWIASALVGG